MRETRLNIRLATILQKTQKNDFTPNFCVYKACKTLLIMPSQRKLISTIAHNMQITAHKMQTTAHDVRSSGGFSSHLRQPARDAQRDVVFTERRIPLGMQSVRNRPNFDLYD
jgi:hypothetical protein